MLSKVLVPVLVHPHQASTKGWLPARWTSSRKVKVYPSHICCFASECSSVFY